MSRACPGYTRAAGGVGGIAHEPPELQRRGLEVAVVVAAACRHLAVVEAFPDGEPVAIAVRRRTAAGKALPDERLPGSIDLIGFLRRFRDEPLVAFGGVVTIRVRIGCRRAVHRVHHAPSRRGRCASVEHRADVLRRDAEPERLGLSRQLHRRHGDDAAAVIQQRATAVSGVDRGIRLDQRHLAHAAQAAHDAARDRVLQAHGRSDREDLLPCPDVG